MKNEFCSSIKKVFEMVLNAKIVAISSAVQIATNLYHTSKLTTSNISNVIFVITNTMPFQLVPNAKATTSNQPISA